MTQTYRTDDFARWGVGQGFNLTAAQVDNNFWDLVQRMLAQEARPDPGPQIDFFEIIGVNLYVHMTDGTILGPYEMPIATFRDRGEWAAGIAYYRMDTFSISGGLYVVTFDHTSVAPFDPGANDGAGHNYYSLMIQTPGSSLPSGGIVGQVVQKSTTAEYAVMWGYKLPTAGLTGQSLIKNTDNNQDASWNYSEADQVRFTPVTGSALTSDNVADALEEISNELTTGGDVGAGGGVGKQTIWVPASAMTPRITNGPSTGSFESATNKMMIRTLDFDATTPEYAQFEIAMPKAWDLGDVTFNVFHSNASFGTGGVIVWAMDAVSCVPSDTDLDVPFGTAVQNSAANGAPQRLMSSGESDPLTILRDGGDPPTEGNLTFFRIYRDATNGSDSSTVDARLHGVQIFYVTNVATDD